MGYIEDLLKKIGSYGSNIADGVGGALSDATGALADQIAGPASGGLNDGSEFRMFQEQEAMKRAGALNDQYNPQPPPPNPMQDFFEPGPSEIDRGLAMNEGPVDLNPAPREQEIDPAMLEELMRMLSEGRIR